LPEPARGIPLTKAVVGSAQCASVRVGLAEEVRRLDNPIARGA
jgi:hypothetical protein